MSPKNRTHSWRLIDDDLLSGSRAMAVDESLLQSFNPSCSPPVLRLYGWREPTLSLGRFQAAAELLDLDRCRFQRVPFVRRISGGGVIYHGGELTYSIVCSPHHLPTSVSIKDSYRVLTGFLLTFYRNLGLKAGFAGDGPPPHTPLGTPTSYCFAGRETFDILIADRKIGGNAQRRQKQVIFQHGSIPLFNRVMEGVFFLRERSVPLEDRVTSLAQEGITLDPHLLREKLKQAFCTALSADLQNDCLTDGEQQCADRLEREKYTADTWNLNGENL